MTDAPLFSDPALHEAGAIRLRQERTAGDVLATAIRLAIGEAVPFFTAVFAIVAPMVVAGALARFLPGTTGQAVAGVVDAAANLLSAAAALGFVRLYMRGGPLGVADVWDEARGLLGPVVWFALVLAGLAFALVLPVGLLLSGVGAGHLVGASVVVGALALVALVVLTPLISLALVAVGLDAMPPLAAFGRARDLIRPHLGLVVLTLVLVFVMSGFVMTVIGGLFGALFASALLHPASAAAQAVPTAVGTLLMLPLWAVMTLVWVTLYGSLVEMEEGASLGAELDSLATVFDDRPAERPAPRDPSRVDPSRVDPSRVDPSRVDAEDVARPIGRARPSDAADTAPPADPARGFRGGGFSDGAS